MPKDFGRPPRDLRAPAVTPWRLRALQLGVAIFVVLLLASFLGLMLR